MNLETPPAGPQKEAPDRARLEPPADPDWIPQGESGRLKGARSFPAPDRQMAARVTGRLPERLIDEAVEDTFPASDPPFWMPVGR
jgi:hypothetical protein